jgi:hypothetical protein
MLVTRRASPRRNLEQGIDSYRVSTPFGQIGSLCPQSDLKAFRFPRNSLLTEAVQVSLSRATIFCKSASHFLTRTVACRAARRQKNLPKEIFLTSYPSRLRTSGCKLNKGIFDYPRLYMRATSVTRVYFQVRQMGHKTPTSVAVSVTKYP